jgi:hypothetical protein|tara:strand:- start:366 stop:1001 length:636 start_codon:yes stop_codon:yes gene_type:complete
MWEDEATVDDCCFLVVKDLDAMSDAKSPNAPSDEQEPAEVHSDAAGDVPENAPPGLPKKPRITVGRVILLGLLGVVIFMFIQDRRVSSSWTDAHEWLKEQELKAIESGTAFAMRNVRNYMKENYGLYPEDHPNLPKEYYRWSTWIREFTIEIQITTIATNDQVLQGHVRETSLFGMPGKNPDAKDVNATPPAGEAPPTTAPGGGSEGPPGD